MIVLERRLLTRYTSQEGASWCPFPVQNRSSLPVVETLQLTETGTASSLVPVGGRGCGGYLTTWELWAGIELTIPSWAEHAVRSDTVELQVGAHSLFRENIRGFQFRGRILFGDQGYLCEPGTDVRMVVERVLDQKPCTVRLDLLGWVVPESLVAWLEANRRIVRIANGDLQQVARRVLQEGCVP